MNNLPSENLQQFASKLGRPAGSLTSFSHLTPEQIGMLSAAIDRACEQQRETLEKSFRKAVPWPLRGLILRLLRGKQEPAP